MSTKDCQGIEELKISVLFKELKSLMCEILLCSRKFKDLICLIEVITREAMICFQETFV